MFRTDSNNYQKVGGNRFFFNAGTDDSAEHIRRSSNAWASSPTTGQTGEPTPTTATGPSTEASRRLMSPNASMMDTSLRMGDLLQSPSGNNTSRTYMLSPGIGLAKAGGVGGIRGVEGDAMASYTNPLPGGFGAGAAPHHDRAVGGNDEEDCYLPTYLLGVNAAAPNEQYAAPLEPETPWNFQGNGMAAAPGKLFTPFAGYRAPLNAYDADDDAPPQTSLLDLTNDDQPIPPSYIPARQRDTTSSFAFGSTTNGRNANLRDLSTQDLTESMVFGASINNSNNTNNGIDDPALAEARNETPMSVTVFGFPPSAASSILSRFRDLGDVIGFKPPTQGANHFTITYRTRLHAQRAISLNGTLVEDWMIGVMEVPLDNHVDLQRSTMGKSIRETPATANTGENVFRVQKARLQEAPLLTSPVSASGTLTSSVRPSGASDNLYHNLLDIIFQW
ncbi:hypothetical protein BDF19DRAFT_444486 [Syncephalis fuscata]|nr:hypothetical protein BDF19DRAFT_444486 [Syncephalis fuscata]